jgi:hypothetical protein
MVFLLLHHRTTRVLSASRPIQNATNRKRPLPSLAAPPPSNQHTIEKGTNHKRPLFLSNAMAERQDVL